MLPLCRSAALFFLALVLAACSSPERPELVEGSLTATVTDGFDPALSATVSDSNAGATSTVTDLVDDTGPDLLTSADAYTARIVERRSHSPQAFTQGLEFHDGMLFESRGQRGESALTEIDPETGEVQRAVELDDSLFGEGLTVVENRAIVLTWEAGQALVFDVDTFAEVDSFRYEGEGWGLCYDDSVLWMSNGSSTLTQRDPNTFETFGEIEVVFEGTPVERLNELECIDGLVWANLWQSNVIVVIEPVTGEVVARIDATSLSVEIASITPDADVLNGIAYDPETGELLLTGKYWPTTFVVELVPCTNGCTVPQLPAAAGN